MTKISSSLIGALLLCLFSQTSLAKSGIGIEYTFTIENLRQMEAKAKSIQALPADEQHDDVLVNEMGFKGYLWCTPASTGDADCRLNVYESASKAVDGKFKQYLILKFELKSLSLTISFLDYALTKTSEMTPISKPQVFSSDNESTITCVFDKSTAKRVCKLSIWTEN